MSAPDGKRTVGWRHSQAVSSINWDCSYCGSSRVAPSAGFAAEGSKERVVLCPYCSRPTYIDENEDPHPAAPYGEVIENLPDDVERLYTEARRCMSVSAFTAATLTCRKLLMHIAVDSAGAEPNLRFVQYVDALDEAGYIPPGGKGWIDYIRSSSNEANHQLLTPSREQAEGLINFTAMLLRLVYDYPARVPSAPDESAGEQA